MLLDAVIIVLRETLEAGVLISLLLVLLNTRHSALWVLPALVLGLVGSFVYMWQLPAVSTWFDYVGQEVVNASLQYLIFILLLVLLALRSSPWFAKTELVASLAGVMVALAIIREGVEILLFYSGFWHSDEGFIKPLLSGFIGLMIGFSVGGIVYYLLLPLAEKLGGLLVRLVLTFVAAGMVSQATQLLMQADWLPTSLPIWNSNGLLPEQSLVGTLAYAVLGYESTPTALQATIYWGAIILATAAQLATQLFFNSVKPTDSQ
ncbi:FTR1 family protein [Halioxenophilus sp. WMMB6]|uniref:FTR1 family protein n=1 Tax=Halioxenophilus sp. WMMB6 TaxID=3073815 RepID=UPI00295E44F8|nr:FTR1 family protein [Halioxenophilus sp. WMMB6]